MRLKRLELYGYKSFAARTVLEFGEGITAIVGPNGSGKSNVADAIRWVLGEQSYHALRAKTTDDMIFAGSRARPRLGMAEVLLTFDNSQGWLPLEYAEVTVGRRAYRSGENEYLLNGNRVRYRDILDLLGSAGLVRSTYLVIGQGLVDQALSLRPEARRTLFEDAAGLAPHLRKRAEALSRIEETERNLERVNDILNELQPRAVTLRRQAERAEEYLLLAQDLKELQRIWYGYHWQRRRRQLVHAEEQVRAQSALVETQRAFYHRLQQQQEEWAAQEAARRQALEHLAEEQRTLQEQATRVRREQAVMAERQRLYQQQLAGLEEEIRSLRSRQGILQDEIARATQELAEQEALCAANDKALHEARAALAAQDAARRAQEQEAADLEAHLNRLVAALAADQGRLEQLRERRARLVAAGEETQRALRQAEERLRAGQEEGTRLAERAQTLAQGVVEAQERLKALEEETAHLRAQVNAAEEAVRKAQNERERIVARQEMLGRLRQELTGFPPGVREVLSAQEKLGGLVGTVVNLMQVPRELEEAIEAALGPRLHHIVTERWEDAEAAIAHLKRTRAGWATFLPLDTVRPRPALTLRPEPGIVGVASSLVRFEERLRPVFELLLGRIIIVADLATARRLLSRHTGATLLVTLEGETVQPSGALSGGSRKQGGNLLAQEREWRELPPRLAAAEQAWAEAQQHHAAQQQALASSLKQVEEARRHLAQLQAQAEAAQSAARNHTQEMRALERERAWRATRAEEAAR